LRIFEAVQATALRTFGRPEYDGWTKRLVIVSDLLQNLPGRLNMYQRVPSFGGSAGRRTSPGHVRIFRGVDPAVYPKDCFGRVAPSQ
jgi:hypothetical protein